MKKNQEFKGTVRMIGEWTPRHQKILNDWACRVLTNIYADPERLAKFEQTLKEHEEEKKQRQRL